MTKEQKGLLRSDPMARKVWYWIDQWYAPGIKAKTKLGVRKKVGDKRLYFLSKSHTEAKDELGLTRSQFDRALCKLRDVGLLTWKIYRYNKVPTRHIRSEYLVAKYGIKDPANWQTGEQSDKQS